MRRPEAVNEWLAGAYAESAGVPCVGFVACGVGKRSWGARQSVLITEAAEGTIALPEAWGRLQMVGRSGK